MWAESWFSRKSFILYFRHILKIYNYFRTKLKLLWHYRSHFLQLITDNLQLITRPLIKMSLHFQDKEVHRSMRGQNDEVAKLTLTSYDSETVTSAQNFLRAHDLSAEHRHFDTKMQSVWPWDGDSGHRELRTSWESPSNTHPISHSGEAGLDRSYLEPTQRKCGNREQPLHLRLHTWNTTWL